VELSARQQAELSALADAPETAAVVAARARMVLWKAQGRSRREIAAVAGVSLPTVDRWIVRYEELGVAGLKAKPRARPQVSGRIRERVIALTRTAPPRETGLERWSTRSMAAYLRESEGIAVSNNYIATVWREEKLNPGRPVGPRRGRRGAGFEVEERFVVVEGPLAEVLREAQSAATLALVRWLRDHPDDS
jgi:transposase